MSSVVRGIQVNIGPMHINQSVVYHLQRAELPGITIASGNYPQSFLYIQYLIVPSLAVHSTYLPQCTSDHHYSRHGKEHYMYIPPHCCWLIGPNFSYWSFHLISPRSHTHTSLFTIFMRPKLYCTSLLLVTLANRCQALLILARTDLGLIF